MKVIDILNAKDSLAKLNKIKFSDFRIVSNIYKLTKKVNDVLEMVQQEQKKIIANYVDKDETGNPIIKENQYQFSKVENRTKFIQEIEDLKASNVDDIVKIDISLSSIQFSEEDFSGEDMLRLESLINWLD